MICATAVPITASAITEPVSFHPGTSDGSCARPNGSSTTRPPTIEVAERTSPLVCAISRWPQRLPTAYATDATTTAIVPATPHQPPFGCTPPKKPTPTRPGTPATRRSTRTRAERAQARSARTTEHTTTGCLKRQQDDDRLRVVT